MEPISVHRDEYEISTDKTKLDLALIHDFLANKSYWAAHIPFDVMYRAFQNSLCFGVYHQGRQVGFGRVITDYATAAYVGDIFISEEYRGRGLAKWLVETIVNYSELQDLRLWFLGTRDAHGLYEKYGFKKASETSMMERLMTILNPDVYKKKEPQ
jgi:GNAT superfamily N-acetyltransferase